MGSPRMYSPHEVRTALQLIGEDITPMIVVVVRTPLEVDEGLRPATRMCAGCRGTFDDGTVKRVAGTERMGADVRENVRYRCDRCERKAAERRLSPTELERLRHRYGGSVEELTDEQLSAGMIVRNNPTNPHWGTPASEHAYHGSRFSAGE